MAKILLVENDSNLQTHLASLLLKDQHQVWQVHSLARFTSLIQQHNFDLWVLDRFLSDGDLFSVLSDINLGNFKARVLILTTDKKQKTKNQAFSIGINDFLSKPFSLEEFVYRVNNLLCLEKQYKQKKYCLGKLQYYPDSALLKKGNQENRLLNKENDILKILLRYRGSIVNKNFLFGLIWPHNEPIHRNTLDVYIRRIRMKFFGETYLIETIRGIGYKLNF